MQASLPEPQTLSELFSRTVLAYGHRIYISRGQKRGGGHWHIINGKKKCHDMEEALRWCYINRLTEEPPRWMKITEKGANEKMSETLREYDTVYFKRTKNRARCPACSKLIQDAEKVHARQIKIEKYYPVKGIMRFTKWQFIHSACWQKEGQS